MLSRDRSGQAMLEYLVMAMIVLAAIMFGGPFLVNSIGARFRSAENNAGDAFSEKLTQAAAPVCSCNPSNNNPALWPPTGACGAGCPPLATMRQRSCTPAGCADEQGCAESKECCYPPTGGSCGVVDAAMESTLCQNREQLDAVSQAIFGSGVQGRCLDANGGVRGCLTNEMTRQAVCGEGFSRYACVPDITCNAPPTCVSVLWEPLPNTVCVGQSFTQTGECGDTRPAVGTLEPDCPSPNTVACGQPIIAPNGCGACPGKGTGSITCPEGYECKDDECQPVCIYRPTGIYQAAHYFTATHCGHTPTCNTQNVTNVNWISENRTGGRCGTKKSRHRKCGTLYRVSGTICHGDPCVLGMSHNSETQVTFRLGTYYAPTRSCRFSSSSTVSVDRSEAKFNDSTWACDFCSNCGKKNCDAGFAFIGNNQGYNSLTSVASWGN